MLETPGIATKAATERGPLSRHSLAALGMDLERKRLSLGNGLCRSPSESRERHWSGLERQASPSFRGDGAASDGEGLDAEAPCWGD